MGDSAFCSERREIKMKGLRKGLFACLLVGLCILFLSDMTEAETFCVSTAEDLQIALNEAATNEEDDFIQIVQGIYYGSFIYAPTEPEPDGRYGLTIEGGYTTGCAFREVDPDNTVLDAGGSGVVLALSTPDVAADFVVDGVTLQSGNVTATTGGGLFVATNGGSVTLNGNLVIDNSSGDNNGGGIHINNTDTVILSSNTISHNSARYGAGIDIGGACRSIRLEENTFTDNTSTYDGGAIGIHTANTETINIISNTFTNNSASSGGAVRINIGAGTINLINNEVTDNICSSQGGGFFISISETVNFTNNTISGNSANSAAGGGLSLHLREDNTTANIFNNIFWANSAAEGSDIYILNDLNNNFVQSPVNLFNNNFNHSEQGFSIQRGPFTIDASNLDNEDPLFVDPAIDDYHLGPGSPCINAGDNEAPERPDTDKDGLPRIVDSTVDIGAYEYQFLGPPIADFTAFPLSGLTPLEVNFTDESRGTIESWLWDFGDGSTSTDQNPTHVYEYQDIFTVSLTVTGPAGGDTMTKPNYITVVSSDNPDLSGRCREFHSYEFGERVVVKVEVINTGIEKADSFKVAFYLSDNGVTLGNLLDQDTVMGGLNSGKSKTVSCRYESEVPLSGKYIIVLIDSDDQILETYETNNRFRTLIP